MWIGSCLNACLSDAPRSLGSPWESSITLTNQRHTASGRLQAPSRTRMPSEATRIPMGGAGRGMGFRATPRLALAALPSAPSIHGGWTSGPGEGSRPEVFRGPRVALHGHSICARVIRGLEPHQVLLCLPLTQQGYYGKHCWRRGSILAGRRPHRICLQP